MHWLKGASINELWRGQFAGKQEMTRRQKAIIIINQKDKMIRLRYDEREDEELPEIQSCGRPHVQTSEWTPLAGHGNHS